MKNAKLQTAQITDEQITDKREEITGKKKREREIISLA